MIPDQNWSSEQWSQEADRQIAAHDAWKLAEHRKSFAKSLVRWCSGEDAPSASWVYRESYFSFRGEWVDTRPCLKLQTCRSVYVKPLCRTGNMEEWEF